MSVYEHKSVYAGYTVEQWNEGPLTNASKTAYRLALDYQDPETWPEKLARFTSLKEADQVEALIVGGWWPESNIESSSVVEALVMYHSRLPNLKALFIADVTSEECEISWLTLSDVSPLFLAYPKLEHFGSRGSMNLHYGHVLHDTLKSFTLESGGTSGEQIRQIARMQLPHLTDLEIWTGSRHYGWDGTLEDLRPILMGETFPQLRRLAICNSELTDEVIDVLVTSSLYTRLLHLDLSLGTLSDQGARALLNHPYTKRLKTLTLNHHFCGQSVQKRLENLRRHHVQVEIDSPAEQRSWGGDTRYVAIGE